jgi:hypothetical protein
LDLVVIVCISLMALTLAVAVIENGTMSVMTENSLRPANDEVVEPDV